ncbi:MAG: O-antigen ligase family protein [Eubacteriales bacterium]|nr:O-antigen ligase family protein [Eubacteriales bacterium]
MLWSNFKRYGLFILPFLPYLGEFILFPGDPVARFSFEKKLLLFSAPLILPMILQGDREKTLHRCLQVFSVSTLVLSLYSILILLSDGTLSDEKTFANGAYILRTRMEELSCLHPTYHALFSGSAALFLLISGMRSSGLIRWISLSGSAFLAFFTLLLSARMPAVALVAGGAALLLTSGLSLKKKITLTAGIIVTVVLAFLSIPSLHNRILERKTVSWRGSSPTSTYTERSEILSCAVKVFKEHWLTGTGSRKSQHYLDQCYDPRKFFDYSPDKYNPHNQYLSIALAYGIFPLLIFILLLVKLAMALRKSKEGLVFLIFFVFVSLTESLLERQMGVYYFGILGVVLWTSSAILPKWEHVPGSGIREH